MLKGKKLGLAALAGMISFSFGCGGTNFVLPNFPVYQPMGNNSLYGMYRRTDMKKWTIMVHLAADNNLYSYGNEDLNEMCEGLKSDNINVIVLFDGTAKGDSAIYKIKPGGKDIVNDGGAVIPPNKEINSGDPKLLAKFTQWAIKQFPAEHYMVDIWDHGSGIFKGGKKITKSFAYDDSGTNMETKDLTSIFSAASQAAGKKIDILGFDACLMSHLEIAYQVKDFCNILVASEETEPGDGWYYKTWLEGIGKSAMTPAEVSGILVDTYVQSYQNGPQSGSDVTLSATDINLITGQFLPAFNQLGAALQKSLSVNKQAIANARSSTESYSNSDCVDLGHFLKNIQKEKLSSDVLGLATNALSLYERSIMRNGHYNGGSSTYPDDPDWGYPEWSSVKGLAARKRAVDNSSGLVVYFPGSYQGYNSTYDNPSEILFAREKVWGSFLKDFTKK